MENINLSELEENILYLVKDKKKKLTYKQYKKCLLLN